MAAALADGESGHDCRLQSYEKAAVLVRPPGKKTRNEDGVSRGIESEETVPLLYSLTPPKWVEALQPTLHGLCLIGCHDSLPSRRSICAKAMPEQREMAVGLAWTLVREPCLLYVKFKESE